jgi:hypothetical protein
MCASFSNFFFKKILFAKSKDLKGRKHSNFNYFNKLEVGFFFFFFSFFQLKKRKISPKNYSFKKSLFSKIIPFFNPRK